MTVLMCLKMASLEGILFSWDQILLNDLELKLGSIWWRIFLFFANFDTTDYTIFVLY